MRIYVTACPWTSFFPFAHVCPSPCVSIYLSIYVRGRSKNFCLHEISNFVELQSLFCNELGMFKVRIIECVGRHTVINDYYLLKSKRQQRIACLCVVRMIRASVLSVFTRSHILELLNLHFRHIARVGQPRRRNEQKILNDSIGRSVCWSV